MGCYALGFRLVLAVFSTGTHDVAPRDFSSCCVLVNSVWSYIKLFLFCFIIISFFNIPRLL